MVSPEQRAAIAAELAVAASSGTPVPPLTERIVDFDTVDAYAVQALGVAGREAAGARRVGWKVGLTSRAMQRQLGVSEPDSGPLLDDMEVPDGGTVALGELIAPRVEMELAFRLGRDLGGRDVDEHAALAAVDAVLPALEIVDSRIADWRVALADTVADHASCARFVIGGPGRPAGEVDLAALELTLAVDGEDVSSGRGSAVLGHPARALAWLAGALARRGEWLRAGDVVLAGAVHAARPVAAACAVVADAGPLGGVTVHFAAPVHRPRS